MNVKRHYGIIDMIYLKFMRRKKWELIEQFIKEHNYKNVVEIGVWEGRMSRHLLKTCDICLTGIDAYKPYSTGGVNVAGVLKVQKDFNKAMITAGRIYLRYPGSRLIRKHSTEAVKDFKDGSIDLLYIDATHNYKEMKRDIEQWLPKVRKGGMIAGDGFEVRFIGVVNAVVEKLGLVGAKNNIWWYKVKEVKKTA